MIDSHCHFDFAEFDGSREATWRRCQSAGVSKLLIPGVAFNQWPKARELCERFSHFYHSVGLHPWFLDTLMLNIHRSASGDWEAALREKVAEAIQHPKCVAIGECGLDKLHIQGLQREGLDSDAHWQLQNQVLRAHIDLAKSHKLPLILHVVKAHAEMLAILKESDLHSGGVIHAFSGSEQIARQYWQLGFRLGMGGTITYERAQKTRTTLKSLPMEAILLETDAPAMPVSGKQGQPNSPEYLPTIASCVAEIKGWPLDRVIEKTNQNFSQLFGVVL